MSTATPLPPQSPTSRDGVARMTPMLTLVLASATGMAAANVYYVQPMLGLIQRSFPDSALVGMVPGALQLGFAIGLLLLVPLGDSHDRRRLILLQTVALVLALVVAGIAGTALELLCVSLLVGAAATIAQHLIPLAAGLADPAGRGRVLGRMMSGLMSGILLARFVSGAVAESLGWRNTFLGAALLAAVMGTVLYLGLPSVTSGGAQSYRALMGSLAQIASTQKPLQTAICVQGCLFAAFSAFWSTLALQLSGPPFHLGSAAAGAFGLLGIAGILAAPLAGRITDRKGPRGTLVLGAALVLGSYVLFFAAPKLAGLIAGIVLLDVGLQLSMVGHQSIIFALLPEARSRLNTIYMTGLFVAGAAGSATGAYAYARWGWSGLTTVGLVFSTLACLIRLTVPATRREI